MKITRAILAAALFVGATFAAHAGCKVSKATGEKVCAYSGTETGWGSALSFGTVNDVPMLVVVSDDDTRRIAAKEVMFRIEGGETFRLPVKSESRQGNCVVGALLMGVCMPSTTVRVVLDDATMAKLAAAQRTYVTPVDGESLGSPVKLKGSQMKAWMKRLPTPAVAAAP